MAAEATEQSPPPSRPTRGALRARFEDKQDKLIDDAMNRGDTWAKKVRNSQQGVLLDDVPRLCGVLGLKIVSAERICITPQQLAHFQACETIARGALNPSGPKLEEDWDGPA